MKHKNGFVQGEKGRFKKYIVLFGIIFTVAALAVTSLLFAGVFDKKSQKAAVEVAPPAEVHKSIDLSSNGSYSYTGAGAINNGTYINMAATGSGYYYITLPKGSYQVELWGGQGGAKAPSGGTGGRGGYVKASYEVTATSASLYFYIGTKGTDASGSIDGGMSTKYSGGYNGGGNGVGTAGPGGGGGTDVRIGGTTTGYNGTEYRVLVAAGGGGGQTQSTGDGHQAYGSQRWLGESGCTSQHSSSYPNDEGGGGGGWIGGKVTAHSDDGCQGAAGSNYVGSPFTEITSSYGNNTGNGKASIYVVSVNQPPQTKSQAITIAAKRGAPADTTIAASTVASDPNGNSVLFTTTTANQGLFTNSSGGGLATVQSYFTWQWASDGTSLTIKSLLKHPRAGIDGYTAANGFPVYAYMRDNFSTPAYAYILFYLKVSANTVSVVGDTDRGTYITGTSKSISAPTSNSIGTSDIYSPNGANRLTAISKKPLKLNESFTVDPKVFLTGTSITAGLDTTFIVPSVLTDSDGNYQVTGTAATIYNSSKTAVSGAYSSITITAKKPSTTYLVFTATLYVCEINTAYGSSAPNVCPDIGVVTVDIVFRTVNTRPILKSGVSNIVDLAVNETRTLSLNTYFSDIDDTTISSSTHIIKSVVVPSGEYVLLDRDKAQISVNAPNASLYNIGGTTGLNVDTAQNGTPTKFDSGIIRNNTDRTGSQESAFMNVTYSNDTITVVGVRPSYELNPLRSSKAGHFYLLLNIQDKRDTADQTIWLPLAFRVGVDRTGTSYENSLTFKPIAATSAPEGITSQTKVDTLCSADGNPSSTYYFAPGAIALSSSSVKVVGKRWNGTDFVPDQMQPLALDGDNFATEYGLASWGNVGSSGKLNELLRFTSSTTPESVVKSVSEQQFTKTGSGSTEVAENLFIRAQYYNIYIHKDSVATEKDGSGRVVIKDGVNDISGYNLIQLEKGEDGTVFADYYYFRGISITLKSSTMNRYFYATFGVEDACGDSVNNIRVAIRVSNSNPTLKPSDNIATHGDPENDETYSTYTQSPVATIAIKLPLYGKAVFTPYDFITDTEMTDRYGSLALSNGSNTGLPFTLNGLTARYDQSTGKLIKGSENTSYTLFEGQFSKTTYNDTYYTNLSNQYKKLSETSVVKLVHDQTGPAAKQPDSRTVSGNPNVYGDKLFFTRTSDGNGAQDAFTYNPTAFSDIKFVQTNCTGHIDWAFGNKVNINGSDDLGIDFIMVSATGRTNTPAYIDLSVRDRFGVSSANIAVRLQIEVINSKPYLRDPKPVGEMAVTAIPSLDGDGEPEYDEDGNPVYITPTVASFLSDNPTHTALIADLDGDTCEFIQSRGIFIANTDDLINKTETDNKPTASASSFEDSSFTEAMQKDPNGKYLTDYISARIVSADSLQVTARSSSKALESGIFVYFFVTDGHGGTALGYVQVEVINTAPEFNSADFPLRPADWTEEVTVPDPANEGETLTITRNPEIPLWDIESTTLDDKTRSRFIVGSQEAKTSLTDRENTTIFGYTSVAYNNDVRVISTDADNLQNKTVIDSRALLDTGSVPDEDALEAAVPDVDDANTRFGVAGQAANIAVVAFTAKSDGNTYPTIPTNCNSPELIFKWGDTEWIKRDVLISRLNGKALNDPDMVKYFDSYGRWISTDWALHLSAVNSYSDTLAVTIRVRDEACWGGDTVGVQSAYKKGRPAGEHETVSGAFDYTIYQKISSTGIITKRHFVDNYNSTYSVDFTNEEGQVVKTYVPTYDGNTGSTYPSGMSPIKYNGKTLDPTGATGTTLKARTAGTADNTLAGTDSGNVYDPDNISPNAYKYPSVINIPSTKTNGTDYDKIYIPMSFFGQLVDVVSFTDSEVLYSTGGYVGYDVGGDENEAYNRNSITAVASAIKINDNATASWTGATLDANPYLEVDTFDLYGQPGGSKSLFIDDSGNFTESGKYYNNRLSALAVNDKDELNNYVLNNPDSLVGDGRLVYLEEQATKLQEHNFGIVLSKKGVRTAAQDLTLTVYLAKTDSTHHNSVKNEANAGDFSSVDIYVHIDNSPIDMVAETEPVSGNYEDDKLYYDSEAGTYYVNMSMPTSSMHSFGLVRGAGDATASNVKRLTYSDDDYNSDTYRDRAYFYSNSFIRFDRWNEHSRIVSEDSGTYQNVSTASKNINGSSVKCAQNSIKNYLQIPDPASNPSDRDPVKHYDPDNDGMYMPNGGKSEYGTDAEKYSPYFSVSLTQKDTVINIMSNRKTKVNNIAITGSQGLNNPNPTVADVKAYYAERNLVAEYPDGVSDSATGDAAFNTTRVYYPFRTVIYDSNGVGWARGTYVSVEFRIEVTNGTPSLKEIGRAIDPNDKTRGREYTINLAEGDSVPVNLYNVVKDVDMFDYGSGGNKTLATRKVFESEAQGLALETGDYLASPFMHDVYLNGEQTYDDTPIAKGDGTYYIDGGGLAQMGSTEHDVIMWMIPTRDKYDETTGVRIGDYSPGEYQLQDIPVSKWTVPNSNSISFTVNRRTTRRVVESGVTKSVSINEYHFTLYFYDSSSECTEPFTFIIKISNSAPTAVAATRNITMRAGDDITFVTSYYDTFIGANASDPTHESDAYKNSTTYSEFNAYKQNIVDRGGVYGVTAGCGTNNASAFWRFEDITTANCSGSATLDSTTTSGANKHLGYFPLAYDDTPWRLRIVDVQYKFGEGEKIFIDSTSRVLSLPEETSEANPQRQRLALHITALSATVNEPVRITLSDGEGGSVTCNLSITIISSPPVARDYSDSGDKLMIERVGLEGEYKDNVLDPGVFRLFTVPCDEPLTVNVDRLGAKKAKKVYEIPMHNIAYDPDGDNETTYMGLYGDGEFRINGERLVLSSSGYYEADYFKVRVKNDGTTLEITATGYNPSNDDGYEELSFRVADYGNSSYENTIVLTLHIYTMYSDMTNPTVAAKSAADYTSYLAGADKVNVKSRDFFYASGEDGGNMESSKYAFLKLNGNDGNDGNSQSPIVDPDVKDKEKESYTARLYALFDFEDGKPKALSATDMAAMFTRNSTTKTFVLNDSRPTQAYLISAVSYTGDQLAISQEATAKLNYIKNYADFRFTEQGAAIEFTPVASTLENANFVMYVEVEKYLDGNRRRFKRSDAVLKSGAVFTLNVNDSAPTVNTDPTVLNADFVAEGYAGEKVQFKIYDPNDAFGGMFADSDIGDYVTVDPFEEADYAVALADALSEDPRLDWAAGENKERAFTVNILSEENILEITINRRMDKFVSDRYLDSVPFTIKITAHDTCGEEAVAKISLKVKNRPLVAKENYFEDYDPVTNVGYRFYQETRRPLNDPNGDLEAVENHYIIDAQVNFTNPLEINLLDIITDPDYKENTDADSFYFDTLIASMVYVTPYEYLDCIEEQTAYWFDTSSGTPNGDNSQALATVTPLYEDGWHDLGIRIAACDTTRSLSAKTYIRVMDRSLDNRVSTNGLFITLNISVMNDAPYVLEGKTSTDVTIIGSDKSTPTGMLFFIGDFVSDENESDVAGDNESYEYYNANTYLRIFSQSAYGTEEVYSTLYSEITEKGDSAVNSNLFTVTIPNIIQQELIDDYNARRVAAGLEPRAKNTTNVYNQWFVVTPNKGFYGNGSILITIADGDASINADTLTTSFMINVNVLYNGDEVDDELAPISVPACKYVSVDIGTLFPKLEDKLHMTTGEGEGAQTRAAANGVLDQSSYYKLLSVELQNADDKTYAIIEQVGNTPVWTIRAGSLITLDPVRINVKYALKEDESICYEKYFKFSVIKNIAPVSKYSTITFVRYKRTDDILRDLDDSNSIRLEAWQLCSDEDDPSGSNIRFLSAVSQVPSLVKVSLSEDKRYLTINFVARGQSNITLEVTDETGNPTTVKFLAINSDLPEGSFWLRFVANFEANQVMWWFIIGGVALLIILLIVIITVLRKRKRSREELEALLVSEMELEETMLRLAGGPYPTGYESYGYLPGGGAPDIDPGLMLGGGATMPDASVLGLAAGGGEQTGVAQEAAATDGDQAVDPGAGEEGGYGE